MLVNIVANLTVLMKLEMGIKIGVNPILKVSIESKNLVLKWWEYHMELNLLNDNIVYSVKSVENYLNCR